MYNLNLPAMCLNQRDGMAKFNHHIQRYDRNIPSIGIEPSITSPGFKYK